jgi:hypothetical protein
MAHGGEDGRMLFSHRYRSRRRLQVDAHRDQPRHAGGDGLVDGAPPVGHLLEVDVGVD